MDHIIGLGLLKREKSLVPTENRAQDRPAGTLVTVHIFNIVVDYRIGVAGFLRILTVSLHRNHVRQQAYTLVFGAY